LTVGLCFKYERIGAEGLALNRISVQISDLTLLLAYREFKGL